MCVFFSRWVLFPWFSVSFGVASFRSISCSSWFVWLSPFLALPCCRSAVPVFSLSVLSVLGSLVAHSISLPLVVLSLPSLAGPLLSLALFPAQSPSVCGLFCSGPSFYGWVRSFLFLRVPSFRHEVLLCCFSSFQLSAFQDSLPSSIVSFFFIPPGLELPFVSALFRWALLWLSCLPSHLVCFTIGLLFSLLSPGFSFLLFSFSLCIFLLVPSFPPFSRWSSFLCLASACLVRILWAVSFVVSSVVLSLTSLCSGVFARRLRLLCSSFSFLDLF